VACTPNPENCGGQGGCKGATAELAYEYALTRGLMLEADFPARPHGAQATCPSSATAPPALLSKGVASKAVIMPDGAEKHVLPDEMRGGISMGMLGWTKMPENKELPLVRALVEYGPLAIAVAAGHDWNWYYHGILTPQGCDTKYVISHAVVLFGYGTAMSSKHGEVKYWNIKNSWGRSWGEDGMLRLQRLDDEEGYCGWDKQPEVGSGCDGGPSKVWVCGSCGILYDAVLPMFRL
jgi:cathepsin L